MTALSEKKLLELSDEEVAVLPEEELRELRRRITAAMTKEDWKTLMNRVAEGVERPLNDELILQQKALYKQSDRYKEFLKRKQAEQDNETETTEKQKL